MLIPEVKGCFGVWGRPKLAQGQTGSLGSRSWLHKIPDTNSC